MEQLKLRGLLLFVFSALFLPVYSQQDAPSADRIYEDLRRLSTTGSALYLAAHPDDENTRLIAYLENELHIRTAYLSLTRGDGGQNLIGPEKGAALGLIRTQELLEARKIDGGEQFFTRAVDFGYSKSAEETFEKWDKEKILADVVWVIRKFRPDVILTRFPSNGYGGHGHHTASAVLAEEAFELAGDPDAFPEQLKYVDTWQPERLYFNSSSWWDEDLPEKAKNSDEYVITNVGQYNPVLGKSYNEIAARSRSQHRSQGFGAEIDRGDQLEYLKYVKGSKVPNDSGIFSGIDTGWSRYWGGEKLDSLLVKVKEEFDIREPSAVLPTLVKIREFLSKMPDSPVKRRKIESVSRLVSNVAGIYMEATSDSYSATPGDSARISFFMVSRGGLNVSLDSAGFMGTNLIDGTRKVTNEPLKLDHRFVLPENTEFTGPYWLRKPYGATFQVDQQPLIGNPETPHAFHVGVKMNVEGEQFSTMVPVRYKWVNRARGELWRDFEVLPPATMNFDGDVLIFADNSPKEVALKVRAHGNDVEGNISIDAPKGWKVNPKEIEVSIPGSGETRNFSISLQPTDSATIGDLKAKIEVDGTEYDAGFEEIAYDHIETQVMLPPSKLPVRKLDVKVDVSRVGYIPGSGDEIPSALRLLGVEVIELDPTNLNPEQLNALDAVVIGIRAYNVEPAMHNAHRPLMDYVQQGGTVLAQYSKSYGLKTERIGPYSMGISRDRVTVEEAEAKLLEPNHPIFSTPNRIVKDDFDGWVQERGLYFAGEWSEEYTPLISWNDPGEKPVRGALVVADYGKGKFIYTGISFFRQLPAGVPGAFRLFANLVSYGSNEAP